MGEALVDLLARMRAQADVESCRMDALRARERLDLVLGMEANEKMTHASADFRKKAPRADEFNIHQLAQRIRTLEAKGLDPAGFEIVPAGRSTLEAPALLQALHSKP